MSDVYSFGVFLLELVTGQEALRNEILGSNESLVQWVGKTFLNSVFRLITWDTRKGKKNTIVFEQNLSKLLEMFTF